MMSHLCSTPGSEFECKVDDGEETSAYPGCPERPILREDVLDNYDVSMSAETSVAIIFALWAIFLSIALGMLQWRHRNAHKMWVVMDMDTVMDIKYWI